MKYSICMLLLSTLSFGAVHAASRTVKYVATASPVTYVKGAAKGVKATAKVVSFPVVHPKKTARGVYKAGTEVF